MKLFKNVGKVVGEFFKRTGDKVVDTAGDVGDKIVDVGEGIGDVSKDAFDKISGAIDKIDIKLPTLPKMPPIKGPTGKDFIKEKREWIEKHIADNAELISDALEVAKKLAEHKDELRAARKSNQPLSDALMRSTGAAKLMSDASDKGLKSVSVGIGGDGSLPTAFGSYGGNGTAGMNNSIDGDGHQAQKYLSIALSGGVPTIPSVDGSVAIGFWSDVHDEIGGWSHGAVAGGSYGKGAALAFFWKIGGDQGGDFAGWSISPQLGMSAELEYNVGYTFN